MEIPEWLFVYLPYIGIFVLILVLYILYRLSKQITHVHQLMGKFKNRKLTGLVLHVGDGDGFKMIHIPIITFRKTHKKEHLLSIRLAAVDAPEVGSYGKSGQPFAEDAKNALIKLVKNKNVKIQVLDIDHYSRIVAMVYVKSGWFGWKNVNLEMVKLGMVCVYRSTFTAFGGLESTFNTEELKAKRKNIGIWSLKTFELPKDYKKRNK